MAGKWRLTVVGARRHPGRVWDVGSRQGATNTMSGVSLPACQAKVGPVWQPLAPQSHLAWALLVMFGGVRETLLPSAPSQGTNLGADMQGGQGQIHYKYSTLVLTTIYKCTTDSRRHTNTLQIQCNIHIQGEGPGAKGQTAPGVRSEDPLPSSF